MRWAKRINAWERILSNSKLYHYYGDDMNKYYALRFKEAVRQYACIEYLNRMIGLADDFDLVDRRKRKKYFKRIFRKGGVNKYFTDTPYNEEVLNEIWELHYKGSRSKRRRKAKRAREAIEILGEILSREAGRIWQQWKEELPGDQLVAVFNGNNSNSKALSHFQSPLEPLALISSRVGQEGIDLQAFTKGVIHYDLDWSPGKMEQREGRVDRIGRAVELSGKFRVLKEGGLSKRHLKKEDIQIHYLLMPHTYDERKYNRMRERQDLFNLLVPANLEDASFHFASEAAAVSNLSFKLGVDN